MLAAPLVEIETVGAAPHRRDVARRVSGERAGMLRFVIGPDRRLVPDLAARLPGRGIWVAADAKSLATAVAKRLFDRPSGGPVTVPEDLPAQIERLLAQRCGEVLGLARRAGELVCGFDQVAAMLATGAQGVLVTASDAAADGARKLGARQGSGARVAVLSRAEIGQALGRDTVVHAWLRHGRLATRLLEETARLQGFRSVGPAAVDAVETGGAVDQQGMSEAR